MFGEDIMIAPIVTPVNTDTTMVQDKYIWMPPGKWIDDANGKLLNGNQWYIKTWDLSEVPIFVK